MVDISYIRIHRICYILGLAQMGENQSKNQSFETEVIKSKGRGLMPLLFIFRVGNSSYYEKKWLAQHGRAAVKTEDREFESRTISFLFSVRRLPKNHLYLYKQRKERKKWCRD